MEKLVLIKHSTVKTKARVENQCKVDGHEAYNYEIEVETTNKLDESGFIIDHTDVHNVIDHVVNNQMGSCEQLCVRIENAVFHKLLLHGAEVLGINFAIKPVDSNAWVKIITNY